jgi:heme A synthase
MQCPFCKEEIKDGAIKCKHCGSMLQSQQGIKKTEKISFLRVVAIVFFLLILLIIYMGIEILNPGLFLLLTFVLVFFGVCLILYTVINFFKNLE